MSADFPAAEGVILKVLGLTAAVLQDQCAVAVFEGVAVGKWTYSVFAFTFLKPRTQVQCSSVE